jgi:hypothetical protein
MHRKWSWCGTETGTAINMLNDYRGPLKEFAMVVPVPVVLQKEDVKTPFARSSSASTRTARRALPSTTTTIPVCRFRRARR